jgi:hypothetical protein
MYIVGGSVGAKKGGGGVGRWGRGGGGGARALIKLLTQFKLLVQPERLGNPRYSEPHILNFLLLVELENQVSLKS